MIDHHGSFCYTVTPSLPPPPILKIKEWEFKYINGKPDIGMHANSNKKSGT